MLSILLVILSTRWGNSCLYMAYIYIYASKAFKGRARYFQRGRAFAPFPLGISTAIHCDCVLHFPLVYLITDQKFSPWSLLLEFIRSARCQGSAPVHVYWLFDHLLLESKQESFHSLTIPSYLVLWWFINNVVGHRIVHVIRESLDSICRDGG